MKNQDKNIKKVKSHFETRKGLIKKLDDVFSKYIRKKYSVSGIVKCYTCGSYHEEKHIQAGHFISRKKYSVRWDEVNVKPQCLKCNIFTQGEQAKFEAGLIKEYGQEAVEMLKIKSHNIFKADTGVISILISDYRRKLELLRT